MNTFHEFGKILAHPLPGDEVVISGFSGNFPESGTVEEFMENLFHGRDMLSGEERRWKHVHPELPKRNGMLKSLDKFDGGFFGMHAKQVESLSYHARFLLEKSIEAILDAGVNPADLAGTKTGVFLGACFCEPEIKWYFVKLLPGYNAILGNGKSYFTDRIAYFLKLKGVSTVLDTACNSSMAAFDAAYRSIRTGQSDMAIVLGANLCLHPNSTLQFARLGVLSKDDHCRVFDEQGTGYIRSEAIVAMFLQKAKDSNRIYARVVHAKSNSDGYKEQGITYPSGSIQKLLLDDVYAECGVDPVDLSYLEAHGTGTKAGDPEEMNCVDEMFAKKRETPLLVGSVKSSIGHCEPASGLCSIAKAILTLETGVIPPNLHINTPRKNVPAFYENRLKIVTELTPLQDNRGLIGVNSFGFGGSNTHVLLKWNKKSKENQGKPYDNLPRLICVSGRTEDAVKVLLDDSVNKFDVEHIRLIQNIFRKNIANHLYRGFAIASINGEINRSTASHSTIQRQLIVYFDKFTKYIVKIGPELLELPILKNFNKRIQTILSKTNTNLKKVFDIESDTKYILTQAALVEILKELELKAEFIFDESYNESTKAYVRNSHDLEDHLNRVNFTKVDSENNTKKYNNKNLELYIDGINNNGLRMKDLVILDCGHFPIHNHHKSCTVLRMNYNAGILGILEIIGRLYELGFNPQTQKLYPTVEFPVSRGTPMISSKILWDHSRIHEVDLHTSFERPNTREVEVFEISSSIKDWEYLDGHCIDGRDLFPATGYLYLAWKTLANLNHTDKNLFKVVFENCKFLRACTTPKSTSEGNLNLMVMYQRGTGRFEITQEDVPVVTGTVKQLEDQNEIPFLSSENGDNEFTLNRRDIYKELRLRGYHYKGLFRGLTEANKDGTQGKVEWNDNWIAFMDTMLQMKILGLNSRLLYVPTSISKLIIDPVKHNEFIREYTCKDGEIPTQLPVEVNHNTDSIRCGGVKIQGLNASSITRRKNVRVPVIEKYEFVPNNFTLPLEDSLRVLLQIALENNCGVTVKIAELLDADKESVEPLSPMMQKILEGQPLVQSDVTILSSKSLDVDVKVENQKLATQTDCTIVVGDRLLDRPEILQEALLATITSGYLLSRESLTWSPDVLDLPNLAITNIHKTMNEQFVFVNKTIESEKENEAYVRVSDKDEEFTWLQKVQELMKANSDVIIYAQDEPLNGVLGLVNCIKREPGSEGVRLVLILDEDVNFDPSADFFKKQLDKKMTINILKNGEWGTYRHLMLGEVNNIKTKHCYANTTIRGDLSSMKWLEGPLSSKTMISSASETLVKVCYSSLNFRDVMTASGRINADVITKDRRDQECVQGFEFSGKTLCGRRVMGMVAQGALATLVKADEALLWNVPDNWTLEQAATVPVVYGTCLYALVVIGRIKKGESVLIHSGTGGIGQAAINLCLHMGCIVFTTVGTVEKREFIKKNFPQINEKHIGNSRDLSFQSQILKETKGRGVDIVLNSLAEEKLFASLHCLARNGRFLEIGKFDLANDNQMKLWALRNAVSYHGVMLDRLFAEPPHVKKNLNDLIQSYIEVGAIKPLTTNVFMQNELEQAFRFMSSGKHIGKVLIKIRNEMKEEENLSFTAVPRYCCDPASSYIICGGLGGFGLELADWLVLRGARNIVLTSRSGVRTGYQMYRISTWRSYGCKIHVSTEDITSHLGCEALINAANSLAPVEGIFNLAVVLQDAILENQTPEMFKTSFGPKAHSTEILDMVSRKLCPHLKEFVVFSSVSCGRGNAGQSNYGMSNSVMERICETRRDEGLPALAIQWGAIGEVGLVAELHEEHIELAIGGTLQQTIASCLQCMDIFMRQKESPIVSSIVVAEKKIASSSNNVFEAVAHVLGIRDVKSVSKQSTLAELGMDSMNAVEIKQTLERDFGIFLTPPEIRKLTFAGIQELQDKARLEDDEATVDKIPDNAILDMYNVSKYISNMETLNEPVLKLKSKSEGGPTILALPGMEGVADQLKNLALMLDAEFCVLQYYAFEQKRTIEEITQSLYPHAKAVLQNSRTFLIVAHSMGAVLAIELVKMLEKDGLVGTLTCIDGSPDFIRNVAISMATLEGENHNLEVIENSVIKEVSRLRMNEEELQRLMIKVSTCVTLEEKLDVLDSTTDFTTETKNLLRAVCLRVTATYTYKPEEFKLNTKISLFKPSNVMIRSKEEDYGLGRFTIHPVNITCYDGDHSTILSCQNLADDLMDIIKKENMEM